ncbi:hypothetical protein [Blastococcus sp. LR1]|uniref:hypothetical protein n=1 Tax=Blastococcus sp. LR1 TaxID=2877000 RepID=UPI001CCB2570|nr:hypothetical protein [Blastococcus sp. LR1]MCA0144260.1 hypothetical protein [Blastococcus sp. LR1]
MASASGGGPTVEQIEGRLNRLEARRTAVFNVASVVAVGVLTTLGTLGGVWLGTSQTADAQDARADEDFAREQRIETYGEFLGAIDTSYALMATWLPSEGLFYARPMGVFDAPPAETYAEIVASLPLVRTLSGRIDVIGGEEVARDADQLAAQLELSAEVIRWILRCNNEKAGTTECIGPPSATFLPPGTPEGSEPVYFKFLEDREEFLRTATAQLNLPNS